MDVTERRQHRKNLIYIRTKAAAAERSQDAVTRSSKQIKTATELFLASGGEINEIPTGQGSHQVAVLY